MKSERDFEPGIMQVAVDNPGKLHPAVLMTILRNCLLTPAYRRVILHPHEGKKGRVYSSIEVQRRLRKERELMGEICIQAQQDARRLVVQSSRPAHRSPFKPSF